MLNQQDARNIEGKAHKRDRKLILNAFGKHTHQELRERRDIDIHP